MTQRPPGAARPVRVHVCSRGRRGRGCAGHADVRLAVRHLRRALGENAPLLPEEGVVVEAAPCFTHCAEAAVVRVDGAGRTYYRYASLRDLDEIVIEHVVHGRLVPDLLLDVPGTTTGADATGPDGTGPRRGRG